MFFYFFFQAEDGIRDSPVTGVQTCALPILEATASYSIFNVGYGDKEGTGVAYTAGVSHDLNESVSVYAEGEMKDLDSGSDTTSWSIGSKFTF